MKIQWDENPGYGSDEIGDPFIINIGDVETRCGVIDFIDNQCIMVTIDDDYTKWFLSLGQSQPPYRIISE